MKLKLLIFIIFGLIIPAVAVAQTTSSTNYQVEDGTFDGGGEPSSSTNYSSRDSIGDVSDEGSSSTNYKSILGFQLPAYPGVPGTPTLTNTGGILYTELDFVVVTGNGQQTDTNYAIAISSDNFVTTNYVQTDDTVGPTPAWQTYTAWGAGTGERIVGLSASTTYQIKTIARYGPDSESGWSQTASASTVGPNLTVTFAGVSSGTTVGGVTTTTTSTTNAIAYGSLSIGAPLTAAHQVTVSTNASNGYTSTVQQDGQLRDGINQIDPVSGTNASPTSWSASPTTGEFGYHTTDSLLCTGTTSRFAVDDTFAQLTTSPLEVACSTTGVTNESTYLIFKLEIGASQPNGSYQNLVTYITTAQF